MASKLNTALDNRIQLKDEGTGLLAIAATARTPRQAARLDAIEREITGLDVEIERLRQFRADEIASATGDDVPRVSMARSSRGRKFGEMFGAEVARDRGGFSGAEEFLAVLHSGLADPRLLATHTTQVDSSGGFSVPAELRAQWLDSSLEDEIVRPRADVWPMGGSTIAAVGFDDGSRADNLFGGFAGGWSDEDSDLTLEEVKLRRINLRARKLGILAQVSNELVSDGQGFDAMLGGAMSKSIGWYLDRAFFAGNGANAPMGIFNAACTVTVAKELGQSAATIEYENLTKMYARMLPGSHERAVWVANSTCIPKLLEMSIAIGTGGSHIPVLHESGGKWTLLTRPVIFSEKVPVLGTVGDIGLFDFSFFVVGMRAEVTIAKSMHVGFQRDTSYYRAILRCDGQPKLAAPVTPKHGDSLSPFVLLASRA